MRDLHEDAGAVAGERVGAGRRRDGSGSRGSGCRARRWCGSAGPSDRRRSRRRRHRARASDRKVLALAAGRAMPHSLNQTETHGVPSSTEPRPASGAIRRGAVANKAWANWPGLHLSGKRGAAESEEPSSLGGERPSCGRRLGTRNLPRCESEELQDQRRPHRKEGQQACPIRPQIDRFPMGAQAGFQMPASLARRDAPRASELSPET